MGYETKPQPLPSLEVDGSVKLTGEIKALDLTLRAVAMLNALLLSTTEDEWLMMLEERRKRLTQMRDKLNGGLERALSEGKLKQKALQ